MKKSLVFLIISFSTLYLSIVSAQTINVRSADGTTDVVYTNPNDLQTAITNASAGSTITLSGGVFNTTNAAINIAKEIHLIGAGFLADSTTQTSRTYIGNGQLNLKAGSDNSSLEGFEINSSINVSENISGATLKNILINKVKVSTIACGIYPNYTPSSKLVSNLIISNSLTGSISCNYATQVRIYNNIVVGRIESLNGNAEIYNNILISSDYAMVSISNTVIKNNIIRGNSSYGLFSVRISNVESNNLTTITWPAATDGSVTSNNISNAVATDIFVRYDANNLTLDKLYLNDFHIKTGSVAKGAGTDGKDLGIYGGDGFRVKPSIPFIEFKEVAKQTNNQGQLPVNIRVKAQGNN